MPPTPTPAPPMFSTTPTQIHELFFIIVLLYTHAQREGKGRREGGEKREERIYQVHPMMFTCTYLGITTLD